MNENWYREAAGLEKQLERLRQRLFHGEISDLEFAKVVMRLHTDKNLLSRVPHKGLMITAEFYLKYKEELDAIRDAAHLPNSIMQGWYRASGMDSDAWVPVELLQQLPGIYQDDFENLQEDLDNIAKSFQPGGYPREYTPLGNLPGDLFYWASRKSPIDQTTEEGIIKSLPLVLDALQKIFAFLEPYRFSRNFYSQEGAEEWD